MQYDIVIIGGGMVGAALACALREANFSIALIDATPLTPSEDPRLIALNYSSYCLFNNLTVWQTMQPFAAAIQEVHVSHRGHFGITRLTATAAQLPTLGYVVPAKHINHSLYQGFANSKNVTLIRPATLNNLIEHPDSVALTITTTEGEKNISAKIVIGADGSHSTVRELLAIPTQKMEGELSAIVTITQLQRSHHSIAYERFLEHGAIAMLPLSDRQVATIWTDRDDTISDLQKKSDSEFLQLLQQQFGYRLGKLVNIGKRYTFPLQWIFAEKWLKNRIILLGNARHTLHPIAAQGLNLALFEVAELAEYLSTVVHIDEITSLEHEKIFSISQPKRSQQLSQTLSWIVSSDSKTIHLAKQIGMIGLDSCMTLKKHFTRRAMGQVGSVPLLLRK